MNVGLNLINRLIMRVLNFKFKIYFTSILYVIIISPNI